MLDSNEKNLSFDNLKSNYIYFDRNSNVNKFFHGLNEFSEIKLYREKAKFNFFDVFYKIKYALAISFGIFIIAFTLSPFIHKLYVDYKYKQIVYSESVYPYAETTAYQISDNIKDEALDQYLNINYTTENDNNIIY